MADKQTGTGARGKQNKRKGQESVNETPSRVKADNNAKQVRGNNNSSRGDAGNGRSGRGGTGR